jgi:hypothetical protein
VSRPALETSQSPIQLVLEALSQEVKWLKTKQTTHLYLVPRLRMCGVILPLLHKSWRHRDNFMLPQTLYNILLGICRNIKSFLKLLYQTPCVCLII